MISGGARGASDISFSPSEGIADKFIGDTTLGAENVLDRAHEKGMQKDLLNANAAQAGIVYGANWAVNFGQQIFGWLATRTVWGAQERIAGRQAEAAENIAGKQLTWQLRLADSVDKQSEQMYGPDGFAERKERIDSQTAIAMNKDKEQGKTERAALRGVDEVFSYGSRDSYGYGNPFASA